LRVDRIAHGKISVFELHVGRGWLTHGCTLRQVGP
jgi:hypothetical protein